MADQWTQRDIPSQIDRTAVITGANGGIGFQAAIELARAGATVVMACRNPAKGAKALTEVEQAATGGAPELAKLDLASLESVSDAAEELNARKGPIDLLINNAGVMATPKGKTAEGFETQIGTNHLGHFALTGRLLDKVLAAEAGRIVTISSNGHKMGRLDFDDLMAERRRYSASGQYNASKLANLLFTFELDRRLRKSGVAAIAVAAHPGFSATNLGFSVGAGPLEFIKKPVVGIVNATIAQPDRMGALPTLYAATAPDVAGGEYIGPDGRGEFRGHPVKVSPAGRAKKQDQWKRLWELSEELTGVSYDALAG